MGGFFGVVGRRQPSAASALETEQLDQVNNLIMDVFLGVDYHSHLGTKSAGLAWIDENGELRRKIHSIQEAPFRSKFNTLVAQTRAISAIGMINDSDPQPLQVYSRFGIYTLGFVGIINNSAQLAREYIEKFGGQFGSQRAGTVNTTELLAAYINTKETLVEGINYAWQKIQGTALLIILKEDGNVILARDAQGRLPLSIGFNGQDYAFSLESFAYQKLGYQDHYRLGAGEIGELSPDGYQQIQAPLRPQKICSFLWVYYGYPASSYEGRNVEEMRYLNGQIMCKNDQQLAAEDSDEIKPDTDATCARPCSRCLPQIDGVAGVPDSGIAHAIGYSSASQTRYLRPFVKYTPSWSRSFMPVDQSQRNQVAKMKLIPVKELIDGKRLLFIDDSIVRGTQLRETVDFLYDNGAEEIHVRSASPPIMYGCKYLNFSRSSGPDELITHRVIKALEGEKGLEYLDEYISPYTKRGRKLRQAIAEELRLASVEFQTIEGIIESINLPCGQLCTYCFNGEE